MVMQLLILALLLLAIPAFVGNIFEGSVLFRWIGGQFLLWAGFQFICVPLILRERDFSDLVLLFAAYMAALMLLAAAKGIRRMTKKMSFALPKWGGKDRQASETVLWAVFGGLLLFQLVQAVRLAYADGDDAYYVAISAITQDADTMYRKLPYTGGETMLDLRHGLAPFPIWISFLARMSGLRAVTVAQVVLPVVLISMSYAVFYLLGVRLFPEGGGRLPLFLIFVELLVLFGDYSFYTAENFMIARSRQGKAALGSIVIPFLFLLLLDLLRNLQEEKRIPLRHYLALGAAAAAGCLCSTLGALLLCMGVGTAGLLGGICYKKYKFLFPLAACCIPCVCYAVLYLIYV